MLPLFVPRAARAGNRSKLCRSRRARRATRNYRDDSSHRDDQIDSRPRRDAGWTSPAFRRADNVRRDPQCPVCGAQPTITEPIDYEQFCGIGEATADAVPAISVHDLKQKMETNGVVTIVDVREPFEYEIARIEGSKLIPLGELPDRLDELDRDRYTVVHCHSGMRSAQAVQLLRREGFANVFNLAGGIAQWSEEIDPEVPKY